MLPALAQTKGKGAKEPDLTRILFVMDASNSMNAFWGNEPKINAARRILLAALKPLEEAPNLQLALRLYGHQTRIEPGQQDCDDTKLEVPFGPSQGDAIRRVMTGVRCLGTTPIARSLERSATDFPDTKARNVIILITDGIEACDEDPCAVSRALQSKGIILKPFVIGIGLEDAGKYNLKCVGNYYDATTPEMFERVLAVVVDQALNTTTTQLLLVADDTKPTETDVPVTFYDQSTGQQRYNFVHTMNVRGRAGHASDRSRVHLSRGGAHRSAKREGERDHRGRTAQRDRARRWPGRSGAACGRGAGLGRRRSNASCANMAKWPH